MQQLEVFQAQTANLRVLEQGWKHIKRGIHRDLLANNKASVELQTKVLALTYCAWSEAAFSKLVHTPHCFELDEIRQIKTAGERGSIVSAWEKCVALALRKIRSRNGNYVPNVKQELSRLIKTYIETPSQLRNKVAHGQWQVALNSKNTALNTDLTGSLANLDLVKLDLLKKGCEGLCLIVEALVESPVPSQGTTGGSIAIYAFSKVGASEKEAGPHRRHNIALNRASAKSNVDRLVLRWPMSASGRK